MGVARRPGNGGFKYTPEEVYELHRAGQRISHPGNRVVYNLALLNRLNDFLSLLEEGIWENPFRNELRSVKKILSSPNWTGLLNIGGIRNCRC